PERAKEAEADYRAENMAEEDQLLADWYEVSCERVGGTTVEMKVIRASLDGWVERHGLARLKERGSCPSVGQKALGDFLKDKGHLARKLKHGWVRQDLRLKDG